MYSPVIICFIHVIVLFIHQFLLIIAGSLLIILVDCMILTLNSQLLYTFLPIFCTVIVQSEHNEKLKVPVFVSQKIYCKRLVSSHVKIRGFSEIYTVQRPWAPLSFGALLLWELPFSYRSPKPIFLTSVAIRIESQACRFIFTSPHNNEIHYYSLDSY